MKTIAISIGALLLALNVNAQQNPPKKKDNKEMTQPKKNTREGYYPGRKDTIAPWDSLNVYPPPNNPQDSIMRHKRKSQQNPTEPVDPRGRQMNAPNPAITPR